ncbi:hypothetical protein GA0061083_3133, partial [Pseudarthrobacter enclensis]|uniref:hypothetical protein n=1 Tax=Pseudarthrobacter enclensis TaxID=993070 RepID=UPI00081591F5
MNFRGRVRAKAAAQGGARRQPFLQSPFFSTSVVSLALGALVVGAVIHPGFRTTEVDLNDGGVWVVSKSKNAVGRLNYP